MQPFSQDGAMRVFIYFSVAFQPMKAYTYSTWVQAIRGNGRIDYRREIHFVDEDGFARNRRAKGYMGDHGLEAKTIWSIRARQWREAAQWTDRNRNI